jgi:hypothetical protein
LKLHPHNLVQLQEEIRRCASASDKIEEADVSGLSSLVEHSPEDMTATVEAGMSFTAFQQILASQGQWLPIDPPLPEATTIRDLLDHNISGPRRCGYGTVRDYVIGIKVALANGEVIRSGGKVVKNVAGYDLAKLFIGAKGTLGVIVEVTFKLRPKPEAEAFFTCGTQDFAGLENLRAKVRTAQLNPAIFDVHCRPGNLLVVHLGFDGAQEDVDQQEQVAAQLGFAKCLPTGYWSELWLKDLSRPVKRSVLPSKTVQTLAELAASSPDFEGVAHLQNGIIYCRNGPQPSAPEIPVGLMIRTKEVFDPSAIFPKFKP